MCVVCLCVCLVFRWLKWIHNARFEFLFLVHLFHFLLLFCWWKQHFQPRSEIPSHSANCVEFIKPVCRVYSSMCGIRWWPGLVNGFWYIKCESYFSHLFPSHSFAHYLLSFLACTRTRAIKFYFSSVATSTSIRLLFLFFRDFEKYDQKYHRLFMCAKNKTNQKPSAKMKNKKTQE